MGERLGGLSARQRVRSAVRPVLEYRPGLDGRVQPGVGTVNEPLRGIQGYKIRGGAGYRPDHSAEMYADMVALARLALLANRRELARNSRPRRWS